MSAATNPVSPPVLALVGPTASGKSGLALALAARWPVEVVSMDSALVYRGMDIGSAKPSAAEQAQVPHHLIDIRDPQQSYSAAEFAADARPLLQAIQARGRIPLLVGGTFLYLKALTDGLDAMPSADPALRLALQQRAAQLGWPALHAELARCDPLTAARLSPNDGQRIGRALEVWQSSGRPLSSFQRASGQGWALAPGCLISLEPDDRQWLHQRITQRLQAMFDGGLLDEVRRLRAQPGLHPDLPSMRCVGYRQCWQALDAAQAAAGATTGASPDGTATTGAPTAAGAMVRSEAAVNQGTPSGLDQTELFQRCLFATRQLAKRQLTWLRSLPERHRVACDAPDAEQQVLRHVEGLLAAQPGAMARSHGT